MDADNQMIGRAVSEGWRMRTGAKLGRTLYFVRPDNWTDNSFTAVKDRYADLCIGIVDNADLAHRIVTLWNQGRGASYDYDPESYPVSTVYDISGRPEPGSPPPDEFGCQCAPY